MTGTKTGKLARNTVYLYALAFSSQVIGLVTIPYQTRVLSPEVFGVVGFITGVMSIVSLCANFGFLYSSTEKVALHQNNKEEICRIYTATFAAKIVLIIAISLLSLFMVCANDLLQRYAMIYAAYLCANFLACLLPDFLYRGLEQMKTITIRTVFVRVLSAILILLFMKSESDLIFLPGSLVLGNALALVFCFFYDRNKLGIVFVSVDRILILKTLRDGLPYFVSRIASTVYQSGNAVVLGMVFPGQIQVGWFSASDKVLMVVKQVSSPVADSLFPYMVKERDYRLALRLLLAYIPVMLVFCSTLFLFADDICALVFGEGYRAAGNVLRCLIPAMAVIFPTYIICFPILVPMGLSKYANLSNVIGMICQLAVLAILFCADLFNVYTVCMGASLAEVSVFLFRLITLVRHRNKLSEG